MLQPADVSSLSFEIGGQLKAVTLTVGQKVQLGDVLAEIDPRSLQTQVEQADAGVQQAQAQLDNAEGDFQRKDELLKRGVATQAVFDQSRATLLSSRAQLDQARRQLELANHNLDRSKLLAPFAGTIARVEVKSFAQVAAGQPIATLYSDDRFEMSFLAPSPTFQSLKVGQKVDVKIADMPDLALKGEIKELGSKAEQVSAFPVVVRLDNSAPGLNAGMSVEVSIEEPLIGGRSGFLLPLSVLAPEGARSCRARAPCFVYDRASSTVKKRTITVGGVRDNRLVVTEGHCGGRYRGIGRRLLSGRRTEGEASSPGGAGAVNLLTRFGLARSRFTIAAMISLLLAGIVLYPNFPKREDPVIVIRTAVVSALFPGMAPERMENLVAVPIERKIRELAEVKDIRTLASEGSLTIYVDLKDEIGNVNATWQRLRDKMGDVKIELPDGVIGPFVNSDFGDVAIATIAITGEGFSPREMKDVAEDFRKKLYQLSGISKVELFGVQDERVWLELDTRKLAAVGVQVNALIKDLQGQNVVLPSGNINADGTRLLLETSGDFPSVRAIETMLTRVGTTDSLVRLADLVTVRRDYVSPKVKPIYFNGRPAVVLSVIMQPDQDVTQLGGKLRAAARDYEQRLPIGYAIDFATYQADQVSASVNSALSSVAQTFIVVAVLVVLFLGLRAGTVAAMIVPFAVMFSLIGMRALGIALEQVSIAAIIIALGLLVDNGVVIVEDIVSRIGRGVPPQEAGLASGEQYALPLLISSITTIAAFLPLLLLSGASANMRSRSRPWWRLTLGGSWIAALYILPALTVWLIGRRGAVGQRRCGSFADAALLWLRARLRSAFLARRARRRASCWSCWR